ncbi:unnamed protein product, partial [Allacma fusca]
GSELKMALVPGLGLLNKSLRHCSILVSSCGQLYSAACSILATMGPWVLGLVAAGVILVLLPDIMRQIAIWIARVRREFHNIGQSLKLGLEDLEGHLRNMGY